MVISESGSKLTVITAPLSLHLHGGESNEEEEDYTAPNIVRRILSLFRNVRPGSDLTTTCLQLPPIFNLPKSQLQCYGESVYCNNIGMLMKVADERESPLTRFVSVVAWTISTVRPLPFGVAPYNPVLGETHHVSVGTLNVLLEQVSHHPPVTALHATDEKLNIELIWCHSPVPKFRGYNRVETEVRGNRLIKLHNLNETYTINSPKLVIKLLPLPRVDWLGNVTIQCHQTGLSAELCYGPPPNTSTITTFLQLPRPTALHRSIKGRIFNSSSLQTIYQVDGHWDRIVSIKDAAASSEVAVIYNANEVLSGLKTPIVKDPRAVVASESAAVWGEVSRNILKKNWEKAREEKNGIEERQRELAKQRKLMQESWIPKHFTVTHRDDENGWQCLPNHKLVPPAPIVVATTTATTSALDHHSPIHVP